jgi:TPR repeat protein
MSWRPMLLAVLLLLQPLTAAAQAPGDDAQRAFIDLQQRANAGDLDAQVALGNAYESGQGVTESVTEAARWYERAATAGHAGAQVNLATIYLEGRAIRRNTALAARWFRAAAAQGDVMAQFNLGVLLETGAPGMTRDLTGAASWFRKAADQGLYLAQYRLGILYEEGRGVTRNTREAAAWYRKAADRDHAEAQLALGALYAARGELTDIVEAHKWLNLAASRWKSQALRVKAVTQRDALAASMTKEQLAEAGRRAIAWQDSVGMGGR